MQTDIYISVYPIGSRPSVKKFIGLIEGGKTQKYSNGMVIATYHQATLSALITALKRYSKPADIRIHIEDEFVAKQFEKNFDAWKENGFLNAKGKPLKNQDEWWAIANLLYHHRYEVIGGKHRESERFKKDLEILRYV